MFLVRFVLWFLRFTGDITNEFIEKNVPFMCASISFYAFFSLFPLLLGLIMIFSIFIQMVSNTAEKTAGGALTG